jgi:hypothetical protein
VTDPKNGRFAGTSEAADGTRTHDLLHCNQLLSPGFTLFMRVRCLADAIELHPITGDSDSEWTVNVEGGIAHGARIDTLA